MKTGLTKWNDRASLWDLFGDVDAFFGNNLLADKGVNPQVGFQPAVNIVESDSNYLISADLPGLTRDDIRVDLNEGILSVSGERHEEKEITEKSFRRFEKRYGKFVRSFRLPENVRSDAIEAKYENGVLEVRVPKAERAVPKKIEIKS